MNLIRFFFRGARGMMLCIIGVALLSGGCNAALLAMVNKALNVFVDASQRGDASAPMPQALVAAFVVLGLARLLTNFTAQILLANFAQRSSANLRRDLVGNILGVPLRQLEEIGAGRLMVSLTEDVLSLTEAMLAVPTFAMNVAVLAGGAVYLGYLSLPVLVAMGGFILIGAVAYRLLIRSGFSHLFQARDQQDRLFKHFRELTEGIKELKLHRERRGVFLSESIHGCTERYMRHNIAAELRFIIANNWTHFLFFTLLGLILFLLPQMDHVAPKTLQGYILATLFLMGPLSGVLSSLSMFGRASAALAKVEALGVTLTARASDHTPIERSTPAPTLQKLEIVGVTHSYHREKEDDRFTLGPINLTFRPGELVFLVGGNGSGKSTLAKLITGLYPPEEGTIRLNGKPVGDHNRDDYRQLFSAVFADFYLFDDLLGGEGAALDAKAREYLSMLHLEHKVKVNAGVLSTTALSSGQRKRLALLNCYLNDRPFYLFDEWASDQDPLFKEVFYTQILPDLKARKKTVLAITHDDHYFHLADRIIKLDYGKIVAGEEPAFVTDSNAPLPSLVKNRLTERGTPVVPATK